MQVTLSIRNPCRAFFHFPRSMAPETDKMEAPFPSCLMIPQVPAYLIQPTALLSPDSWRPHSNLGSKPQNATSCSQLSSRCISPATFDAFHPHLRCIKPPNKHQCEKQDFYLILLGQLSINWSMKKQPVLWSWKHKEATGIRGLNIQVHKWWGHKEPLHYGGNPLFRSDKYPWSLNYPCIEPPINISAELPERH